MVLHVVARVVIAGSHGVAGGVGAGGLESGRKCQFCGCGRTSFRFSRGLSGMQEIISGDALCSMVSQILLLTFPRKYTRKSGAGKQNCIVQTLFPEGFPESGPEPALHVSAATRRGGNRNLHSTLGTALPLPLSLSVEREGEGEGA